MTEFAVIGMQRTGATVLTRMLNTHHRIFAAGEIFHPDATGDNESFYEFCSKRETKADSALFPSKRRVRFGQFLEHLALTTGRDTIGFNVKYASCHHLDGDWKVLGTPPDLLDVLRERGTKIVHTLRDNAFHTALSNLRAQASNKWHVAFHDEYQPGRMVVDVGSLCWLITRVVSETAAFNEYTRDYPQMLAVRYEEMFAENVFSSKLACTLSGFLGVENVFDRTPRLRKIAVPDWRKGLDNWLEVEHALVNHGWAHWLTP